MVKSTKIFNYKLDFDTGLKPKDYIRKYGLKGADRTRVYNAFNKYNADKFKKLQNLNPKITEALKDTDIEIGKAPLKEENKDLENIFKNLDVPQTEGKEPFFSATDQNDMFKNLNFSEDNKKEKKTENEADKEISAVDLEELGGAVPEIINLFFKSRNLSMLSSEESDKIKQKSEVVIKKRAPKLITEYADLISLGIVTAPVIFKRLNEASDISQRVAQKKQQQEREAKENEAKQQKEMQKEVVYEEPPKKEYKMSDAEHEYWLKKAGY